MIALARGAPRRIETARLVLRPWSAADAPALRRSLDRSDAHLRPFIPFMRDEPRSLAQTASWLREIQASFDSDEHHRYAILARDGRELLGETMLLDRGGTGERELGYWLDVNHGGHGYASEASAALVKIVFELDAADRVELHCVAHNTRSVALARRLGFALEPDLEVVSDGAGGVEELMVWSLTRAAYVQTVVCSAALRAFDHNGDRLL